MNMPIASASAAMRSPNDCRVWAMPAFPGLECRRKIATQNMADPARNIASTRTRTVRGTANRISHGENALHPRLHDVPGSGWEAMAAWKKLKLDIGGPLPKPLRALGP